MEDQGFTRKIVFLGDEYTGKSSLISRFVYNSNKQSQPTIGAYEHSRSIYLNSSSKNMNLIIWDVAGHVKFRSLTNMYYRDADGVILVYDVTNRESWINLKEQRMKELEEKAPEGVCLAIVGNKSDLTGGNDENEKVTLKEV